MLILTRKPGESLYIGDDIKITIVELKGHQIRVGIQAPRDLRIYREEIYLQILEENKKAAEAPLAADLGLEGLPLNFGELKSAAPGSDSGTGDSEGDSDEGAGDAIPNEPKRAGLSAFSVHRAGKGDGEKGPSRDPEVQVRRRKVKKADE